jgi:hypothetical protein
MDCDTLISSVKMKPIVLDHFDKNGPSLILFNHPFCEKAKENAKHLNQS